MKMAMLRSGRLRGIQREEAAALTGLATTTRRETEQTAQRNIYSKAQKRKEVDLEEALGGLLSRNLVTLFQAP